jgi:hypothetical protein
MVCRVGMVEEESVRAERRQQIPVATNKKVERFGCMLGFV